MQSDQPQRVAATVRLTEDLIFDAETDRWKKLAIALPVVATIQPGCRLEAGRVEIRLGDVGIAKEVLQQGLRGRGVLLQILARVCLL